MGYKRPTGFDKKILGMIAKAWLVKTKSSWNVLKILKYILEKTLFKKNIFDLFVFVYVCAWVYVYVPFVWCAIQVCGQKGTLDALELELQMGVKSWILWKNSQCCLLLNHLSSPEENLGTKWEASVKKIFTHPIKHTENSLTLTARSKWIK